MENLLPVERRQEPRAEINLGLFVWRVDTRGERFLQEAQARDISLSGAQLSGLETDLRPGDQIGILYLGIEARFRVVWVIYGQNGDKMRVAVHRIEPDACPWLDRLDDQRSADATRINAPAKSLS